MERVKTSGSKAPTWMITGECPTSEERTAAQSDRSTTLYLRQNGSIQPLARELKYSVWSWKSLDSSADEFNFVKMFLGRDAKPRSNECEELHPRVFRIPRKPTLSKMQHHIGSRHTRGLFARFGNLFFELGSRNGAVSLQTRTTKVQVLNCCCHHGEGVGIVALCKSNGRTIFRVWFRGTIGRELEQNWKSRDLAWC